MISWLLLPLAHAAGPCELDGPADGAFRVPLTAPSVRVLIELWVDDAPPDWAPALLDVLDQRSLPASIVTAGPGVDPAVVPVATRAVAGPHELVVSLPEERVPTDLSAPVGPLRRELRPLRELGEVRTVITPIGSRASEALLGKAGFRALIDADGPPTAEVRMAGHLEGQPRVDVVLPSGPYEDGCGPDPRVGPFGPRAADRAATAIQKATRAPGPPVVRVALVGARGAPEDAAVLARWLDTVLLPGGARVTTPSEARQVAFLALRRGPLEDPKLPTGDAGGGRFVGLDQVRSAASGLASGDVLPRTLEGGLSPTEAFLAFVLVLAERAEGDVVRLGALEGPAAPASSSLDGPTPIASEALRQTAKALAGSLGHEVPAALSVDGRLLTATELLVALASAVRGDDPPIARPMAVPEPSQRGLGWGSASLP